PGGRSRTYGERWATGSPLTVMTASAGVVVISTRAGRADHCRQPIIPATPTSRAIKTAYRPARERVGAGNSAGGAKAIAPAPGDIGTRSTTGRWYEATNVGDREIGAGIDVRARAAGRGAVGVATRPPGGGTGVARCGA